MKGVGPGTVLGGRYTVHRRLAQERDVERWTADDTTLGRTVSLLVISREDHRAPAFLDAARRAGSVAHPVLVRVLDVGEDGEVAYVVEEDLGDARTLTSLVTDGGMPGDEVRRVTGEVASALETARQRGLHHLDLTPEDVLRSTDGEVRLRGIELAAVRAGQEGRDGEEAARQDAVGVVALAYAGLTGLWPLAAGSGGLTSAPRVPGGVASPSEIAAGVPRDLDALCRLTLNEDQGPTSPGDYARQVAPWPSRQVLGRPVTPTRTTPTRTTPEPAPATGPVEGPTTAEDADGARPDAEGTTSSTATLPAVSAANDDREPTSGAARKTGSAARKAGTQARRATAATAAAGRGALGAAAGATAAVAAAAAGRGASASASTDTRRTGDRSDPEATATFEPLHSVPDPADPPRSEPTSEAPAGSGAPAPSPTRPTTPTESADEPGGADTDDDADGRPPPPAWLAGPGSEPFGRGGGKAATPAASSPLLADAGPNGASANGGSANGRFSSGPSTSGASTSGPGQSGGVRSLPVRRPAALVPASRTGASPVPARAGAAGAAVAGALGTVGSRVSVLARRAVDRVSELSPDTSRAEPPAEWDDEDAAIAPMVPAEPLTRDESRLALGIVAAFLIVALVIGIVGVSKIGSRTDLGLGDPGPTAGPVPTSDPSASADGGEQGAGGDSGDEGGGEPEPLAILKVEAHDPGGDGAENNNLTPKTYDGDKGTGWFSENYRTDEFGGLKKGLGLIVDLGPNKKPQAVRLTIPQKVDLEVYVGPNASLEEAKKVGEEKEASGDLEIAVPEDVSGQYIVVWYTRLYPDDRGKRRATLDEVVVVG
ncbi:protein kinase family protein [Phycicoccus sp. CSK15P-2]|uniref:protein kinase family protein n=1 Tax=Phycicoccus sp. CSK15P-2 TaxID=2807627 RepID=UPI00194DB3E6|nr:protein kinase family protein [Phycicoccus sp. CSK15P-2]MBM6403485.1 protein kinase family protein [Phycicoccus sp. CSK15P-2]